MSEPADSEAAQTARAVARKAYKKLKKKRAKQKRSEQQPPPPPAGSSEKGNDQQQTSAPVLEKKWGRVFTAKKSTDRPVDEDKINAWLETRSAAKARKDYAASDAITGALAELEVVYDDDAREWHTRLPLTDAQKQARLFKKRVRESKEAAPPPASKKPRKKK